MNNWTVYIIRCGQEPTSPYYCGSTNDLFRRFVAHQEGKAAKYTRGKGPFTLMAFKKGLPKGGALKLECAVKSKKRREKIPFLLSVGGRRLE